MIPVSTGALPHNTESTMSNPNLVLKYGDFTADFNTLPETSLVGMLRRGFAHYMGSECASKVTGHFDPETLPEGESDTPEARSAYKAQVQAEAYAKLEAGTVGVSTRGPAVDPVETIARRLAKAEILPILKTNGLAWPKKVEDVVSFPDGRKLTGKELIDRRLAQHGDRLMKDAKKMADEAARKAKKAEEAAKSEGIDAL